MKIDPYNHKDKYSNWKERVKQGIPELTKENSDLVKKYMYDMEIGLHVAPGSKKGPRSCIRLNNLRQRMTFLVKKFEQIYGLTKITDIKEEQLHEFFNNMRVGDVKRLDGLNYKSVKDYVFTFKSFWHWYQRICRREGKEIIDVAIDLDISGDKPIWVYLTENQVKQLCNHAIFEYKVLMMFLFDTGIRAPTELSNVKVSDLSEDCKELNIRQETSKTFGRKIKLMLCSSDENKYIESTQKKDNLALFRETIPKETTICPSADGTGCINETGSQGVCAYASLKYDIKCITRGWVADETLGPRYNKGYYVKCDLNSSCDTDISDGKFNPDGICNDNYQCISKTNIPPTTSTTTQEGVCEISDFSNNIPTPATTPDFGGGYAKINMESSDINSLKSNCTYTIYTELMKKYCTINSNIIHLVQWGVNINNISTCFTNESNRYSCNYHSCNEVGVNSINNILDFPFPAPFKAKYESLTSNNLILRLTAPGIKSYNISNLSIKYQSCKDISNKNTTDYSDIIIKCGHNLNLQVGDVVKGNIEVTYALGTGGLQHITTGSFALTVEAESTKLDEANLNLIEQNTEVMNITTKQSTITPSKVATGSCKEGAMSYDESCLLNVGACRFWIFSWTGKLSFLSDSFTESHCDVTKGKRILSCSNGKWVNRGCAKQ